VGILLLLHLFILSAHDQLESLLVVFAFIFDLYKFLLFFPHFSEDPIGLLLTFLLDIINSAFLLTSQVSSDPSLLLKHSIVPFLPLHEGSYSDPFNHNFILLAYLPHFIVAMKPLLTDYSFRPFYSSLLLLLGHFVSNFSEGQLSLTSVLYS